MPVERPPEIAISEWMIRIRYALRNPASIAQRRPYLQASVQFPTGQHMVERRRY